MTLTSVAGAVIHVHVIQVVALSLHVLASDKIDTGPRRCLKCKSVLWSQYPTCRHGFAEQPYSVFDLRFLEIILQNLPSFPLLDNIFHFYAGPHTRTSFLRHTHVLFVRNRNRWHSGILGVTETYAIARLHIATNIVDMDPVSLAVVVRTCKDCGETNKSKQEVSSGTGSKVVVLKFRLAKCYFSILSRSFLRLTPRFRFLRLTPFFLEILKWVCPDHDSNLTLNSTLQLSLTKVTCNHDMMCCMWTWNHSSQVRMKPPKAVF